MMMMMMLMIMRSGMQNNEFGQAGNWSWKREGALEEVEEEEEEEEEGGPISSNSC